VGAGAQATPFPATQQQQQLPPTPPFLLPRSNSNTPAVAAAISTEATAAEGGTGEGV